MSFLIRATGINVIRDRRAVLHDITLSINERDFITIIGPNGAGKSILLKCLSGFLKPDSGLIERKDKLKIGYMPQKIVIDPVLPISVQGFLQLHKKLDRASFLEVVEQTAIAAFLQKPLHVLSGGELQRVLLARALLGDPQLLILDEPAQSLDITGQMAFYKLLEQIYRQRELAILMVSHDLHLVLSCTQQVICLYHHICCSGAPQVVTRDPEFITLFGQDMARLMAVYHHSHTEGHHHDD